MRAFVSVDMEGLAGVTSFAEVLGEGARAARAELARELGWLVDELARAGARTVVVADGHARMRNLDVFERPEGASLVAGSPRSLSMVEGGELGADAAFLLGYHARAGAFGVLAHTYSTSVAEVRLNGLPFGEAAWNALMLGAHGTPVAFVSGDDHLAQEVADLLPWAETVVVKEARGFAAARSLPPCEVEAAIRRGVRRALERRPAWRTLSLPTPLRLEVRYRDPLAADFAGLMPEVERLDAVSVRYVGRDAATAFRAFRTMNALAEGARATAGW